MIFFLTICCRESKTGKGSDYTQSMKWYKRELDIGMFFLLEFSIQDCLQDLFNNQIYL